MKISKPRGETEIGEQSLFLQVQYINALLATCAGGGQKNANTKKGKHKPISKKPPAQVGLSMSVLIIDIEE